MLNSGNSGFISVSLSAAGENPDDWEGLEQCLARFEHETLWTPLLKAIFGFGVGVGLNLVAHKFFGAVHLPIAAIPGATEHAFPDVPALLGPAVGMLYGALIELDDAGGGEASKTAGSAAASKRR